MVNTYETPEEAERRSPYYQDPSINNPQYQSGESHTTSISRWNQQSGQWEYDAEATRQAQEEESRQYQDSQQATNYVYNQQRSGSDPVQQLRNQQAGYGAAQAQKDYFARADIYAVDDPAQLNLMKQGYTAGQAAEMLRFDAQQRKDYKEERKYETLRLQAWTSATGESSAYHTATKESGLAYGANPYEYGADLFTYAEKGYPQKKSEQFSPVDYSILNLPEGKGGQAHIWESDQNRNYDLRGAMDKVAYAQRSGQMGAYGGLSASSSAYGKLSIEEQQAVGRYVNENPEHQAAGFRTNEGAMSQFTPEVLGKNRGSFVSSMQPTISAQPASSSLTPAYTEQKTAGGAELQKGWNPFIASATPISGDISQQAEPSAYRQKAMDAGGEIKRPFLSTSTGVDVVRERQEGALPLVGVVPGISPLIANFMPYKETVTEIGKSKPVDDLPWGRTITPDKDTGSPYGAAYTRSFIDSEGKPSPVANIPVGKPIISEPRPVGEPTYTKRFNTLTGETEVIAQQEYAQDVSQEYETVDLRKGIVTETTKTVREGNTPFTEMVQGYLPSLSEKDKSTSILRPSAGKSSIFSAWNTPEGKDTYLLSPVIGQERAEALGEGSKGVVSFIQKNVPMTPIWAQTSYKNIREDPAFAAPIVAASVAIPATGGTIRYALPGTTLKTITSNSAYKAASVGATAGLAYLFGNYAAKEVTGTSPSELVANNARIITAGNRYAPGEKPKDAAQLARDQWIGWDKAGDKANRLQLEMAAGFLAYTGADWTAMRATTIHEARVNARVQPQAGVKLTEAQAREFSIESNEGFPMLNSMEQKDLRQSFISKKLDTANAGKITEATMSGTGRQMGARDFPTNPQGRAAPGTTDIFTGQPAPSFDARTASQAPGYGYATPGASEIGVKFHSEAGITYFSKAGESGMGLGISEDFLGLGRRPTMYVSSVPERYIEVPKSVRETPTLGLSANDPGNPRNIAITDWINKNAPPGVPVVVQYGKGEWQLLVRQGSEVAPTQHLGYYMDQGAAVSLQRRDYTGRMAPGYVDAKLPVKEYKWYASLGGAAEASAAGEGSSGILGTRSIPYAVASAFRSKPAPNTERSISITKAKSDRLSITTPREYSRSSIQELSITPSRSISRSGSGSPSKSGSGSGSPSRTRTPVRTPSPYTSRSPSKSVTTPLVTTSKQITKSPVISRSTSRSTSTDLTRSSSWTRSPSRSITRSQTTTITPSRTRTTVPIEPPFIGGFGYGSGAGSGRGRGGRKSTQVLTMDFGQVTGSLFGGSPQRVGGGKKAGKRIRRRR